jgi:hypothetical protein
MKNFMILPLAALALSSNGVQTAYAASDAEVIKNAEMAAPAAVSATATIYSMGADGKMKTLREGKTGWWCMPDDPTTPGNDPMCGDANAMAWASAWMGHTKPPPGKVGFMYMLQGGPAGSNTDPYAKTPPKGADWVATGPHVMIVNSKGALDGYPGGGDKPDTTKPYIMWEGTPYEHLMIPIK